VATSNHGRRTERRDAERGGIVLEVERKRMIDGVLETSVHGSKFASVLFIVDATRVVDLRL